MYNQVMPQGLYIKITRFLFLLFAIVNAVRIVFDWEMALGDFQISRGASAIMLFFSAMLTNSVKAKGKK